MPQYDFQCKQCKRVYELLMSYRDYESYKASKPKCEDCKDSALQQVILSAPAVTLPASFTFDGKAKTLAGSKTARRTKEEASVPINIIDEKPGGGYQVTRIGKKGDIDGD